MTDIIRVRSGDPRRLQNGVSAIGNFDGVHLGHQHILLQVIAKAKAEGLRSRLLSFAPLPHEFFSDQPPARIYNLRQKYEALAALGLDELVILHFDQALAQMAAETFANRLLREQLAIDELWVGEDFRFGAQRSGGLQDLQAVYAERLHIEPDFCIDHQRVSSTRVRRALAQGDLAQVQMLLGRPYQLSGHVIHGDKIGRSIGFPTLNIAHGLPTLPLRGVFAAYVDMGASRYAAAVNIGSRPTINGTQARVEAHLIDVQGHFYGKLAHLTLCSRVRDEQKFADIGALAEQLQRDVAHCRDLLA